MEQLQRIILIYGCLGVIWCLYTLFRFKKWQNRKDAHYKKKRFFQFIAVFLLIMVVFVAHISYLLGGISTTWPVLLVIIGLLIFTLLLKR